MHGAHILLVGLQLHGQAADVHDLCILNALLQAEQQMCWSCLCC